MRTLAFGITQNPTLTQSENFQAKIIANQIKCVWKFQRKIKQSSKSDFDQKRFKREDVLSVSQIYHRIQSLRFVVPIKYGSIGGTFHCDQLQHQLKFVTRLT